MAYIHRTNGTATNELIWTLSMWVKQSDPDLGAMLAGAAGATNTPEFSITGADVLQFWTASATAYLATTAKYQDPAAWRHIVIAVDTTQVSASDRIKMYVNGEEPVLTTSTYPSASYNSELNKSGEVIEIGKTGPVALNGVLSHVHFIDGIQYTASTFGETDATSGIWKIKTSPTVTYGNNGFFLKMEDRTNLDLDSSPNAHTMTTSGTLVATYDTPSNNFATLNPLDNYYVNSTYSNGNTTITTPTSAYTWATTTLGVSTGKWYFENYVSTGASTTENMTGIAAGPSISSTEQLGGEPDTYSYYGGGQIWADGSAAVSAMPTYTAGDYIGCAFDLDNNKIYWHKNGTYINSGDPSAGTGGQTIIAPDAQTFANRTGFYFAAVGDYSSTHGGVYNINMGNGYFGTTAVTSTNADDAGIGSFEYDVPTGYYALCTKNIKVYG